MRWLAWMAGGVFLAGLVHISTVMLLPSMATRDAYARLAQVANTNTVSLLAQPSPEHVLLPYMDPAFATAVCLFDLGDGPLKLRAPVAQAYTSITFYTRSGIAFYAINDRAAGRRLIELELMTAAQRAQVPEDEEVTAADRLIVEAPSATGLIVIRALAPEPAALPTVRGVLSAAVCERAQRQQLSRHRDARGNVAANDTH